MRSTQSLAGISVEIFKKLDMILETRIFLKEWLVTIHRAVSIRIPRKQGDNTPWPVYLKFLSVNNRFPERDGYSIRKSSP